MGWVCIDCLSQICASLLFPVFLPDCYLLSCQLNVKHILYYLPLYLQARFSTLWSFCIILCRFSSELLSKTISSLNLKPLRYSPSILIPVLYHSIFLHTHSNQIVNSFRDIVSFSLMPSLTGIFMLFSWRFLAVALSSLHFLLYNNTDFITQYSSH